MTHRQEKDLTGPKELTSVLLCHFGGPSGPGEVEPFLRRLFEDPAIIRAPLGSYLRHWLARRIASKRTPRVEGEYQRIGYSPINQTSQSQATHLAARLRERRPESRVLLINRYTAPFAADVLSKVDPQRERLFLLSLYPHFSTTTTGSSYDEIDRLARKRWRLASLPASRVLAWWDHPSYLNYSYGFLERHLTKLLASDDGQTPLTVLFSAHGIPRRYVEAGDPYRDQITGHFAALKERARAWLAADPARQAFGKRCDWQLAFQSRVGPVEWLRPYTDHLIPELAKTRGGRLLMVPVSFVSDHLETLYEMDFTYKELALGHGFSSFERLALPNHDAGLADCLKDILVDHGF